MSCDVVSVSLVSEDYKLLATGLFCANENAIYMHALLTFMPNYFWHLVNFIFIAARRRQRGRGGAVSSRVRGRRSCDSQLRNTAPGIQPGKANCYTFFILLLTVFVFTVKWSNRMECPVPPPNEVKFLNFALMSYTISFQAANTKHNMGVTFAPPQCMFL